MVFMKSALGGIPVSAAMKTTFETVAPGDSIDEVARLILSGSQQDFPVMENTSVVGVVTRDDLLKGLADGPPARQRNHAPRYCPSTVSYTHLTLPTILRV